MIYYFVDLNNIKMMPTQLRIRNKQYSATLLHMINEINTTPVYIRERNKQLNVVLRHLLVNMVQSRL